MQPPLTPRPAATLILVRDTSHGMEVLMLQRTHRAAFIPGAYVFPGGAVDPGDSDEGFSDLVVGIDDAQASGRLSLESGGLAFWIAAIRECFEEAGLLMAYDGKGELFDPGASDGLQRARTELASGNRRFIDVCREFRLRPAADRMTYFSHWITQLGAPRRFTTRFFAALAPAGQMASHDATETIHHLWISPQEALTRNRSGEMKMAFATVRTLELLAMFDRAETFIVHARKIRVGAPLLPRFARRGNTECILLDDDPAYAEIGKLDLSGSGAHSCEILPGHATQIAPTVRRVTASNAGIMTGPGTNSYVLGTGSQHAVIDPGPADEQHIEKLLEITNGRIGWILVTHTHLDHSPAAAKLKQATGAQLIGMPAQHADRQDLDFQPDRIPEDGEVLDVAGCRLRVVHTPGHASNHLCYFLEEESVLFTGDHIMQGSTVVINPPDGDMTAYLQSLARLKELNAGYIAPGHGFLMDSPSAVIDGLIHHRLRRERKIVDALSRVETGLVTDLLPLAYDDVPQTKHRAAARSLLAHLIKLNAEGRVTLSGECWSLVRVPG